MNKAEVVNLEGRFEAEALRILREVPGLTVTVGSGPADRRADAILRFADTRARVAVEIKQRTNAATAWQLVRQAQAHPNVPLVLIADQTTEEARKILQDHGVAVIDGLGNAHLELPGLLFHLEGRRRPPRKGGAGRPPTRLRAKAGLVAQVLLLHPDRPWRVKDAAEEADVSAGLAHRVLDRLERERILAARGTGPNRVRFVTNPTALLDLWTEENVEEPVRTLGYLLSRTPQQLMRELGTNLERRGVAYALTGAAAASLVAPFITAIPIVDVWVEAAAAPEELNDAAKADPVADGQNVVFLQTRDDTPLAFREKAKGLWVANRFRLYADLRGDPRRGREQAEHLRREVIGL